jgi:hypothetical protein
MPGSSFLLKLLGALLGAALLIGFISEMKPRPSISQPTSFANNRRTRVELVNPKSNILKGGLEMENLVPIFKDRPDAERFLRAMKIENDLEAGSLFAEGRMTFAESGTLAELVDLREGKSSIDNISSVELLKPHKEWKTVWTFNTLIKPISP